MYAAIVAVIASVGIAVLVGLAVAKRADRGKIVTVIFWVLALAVVAMVPLLQSVTVYSFGLLLVIAVVVCSLMLARDAVQRKIDADVAFDLVFWVMVGGIVGARIFYVLLNHTFFLEHPEEIIMIQNGGLAWQGGLILGFITGMMFVRKRRLSLSLMLDLAAPYLALGQAFGRIGCFLNGCCYGKEVSWGVYFPARDAHLHPTQLYDAGGLLIIFLILKRYQRFSEIQGLVFASYLILVSSLRFMVEFFRADHEVLIFGLSVYQYVCFGLLVFAFIFAYIMLIRHSKPDDA
jgi:phosphatidylglycerol:prolipoprotein diacylglycerol transferase